MNGSDLGIGWLAVGLVLALLAGLFLAAGRWQQAKSGLPAGRVIYSDMGVWFPQSEAIYSAEMELVGRPDYLVQRPDGTIIPVEIKSGSAPAEAHEGHVLQLAAYCLLVDEVYGTRPEYGILQYRDKAFAVDYTLELEEDLLDLLADMREDMYRPDVDRDHNDWYRCTRCSVRSTCRQRLA